MNPQSRDPAANTLRTNLCTALLWAMLGLPTLGWLSIPVSAQEAAIARAQDPQFRLATSRTPLPKPTSLAAARSSNSVELEKAQARKSTSSGALGTFFALGIALTLFFGSVLIVKRIWPNVAKKKLPSNVLEVIATTELLPRQQWMLLRFGSKLILVCQQQSQTNLIAEVTDEAEIQRLLSQCEKPHDRSAAFPSFSLDILRKNQQAAIG